MPITVISGLPGAGKSLMLARIIVDLLYRNRRWNRKTGAQRKLYTNLKLAPKIMEEFEGDIIEWTDTIQLTKVRDADVIWDEFATAMDATQWQNMPLELKRWLQQHRKFGIEIYGTSQDFAQVDKSFRRLVSDLLYITKLVGSRDKSATAPPPRWIWGICIVRVLDPTQYNEAKSKFENESILPRFMWITRDDIEIYDTTAEVAVGTYPALRHIERTCENALCNHVKVTHV